MKILILSTKMPWPPNDGGAIATLNLAMGLADGGAEVTLLTMNTRKHYFPPEKIPTYVKDKINIRSVDVDTGINPVKLAMNLLFSSYPYIAERFISKSYREVLEECLSETSFDVVQLEGPYLEYYIRSINKNASVSLRAHNLEHRIWELRGNESKNPFKRWYFLSLAKRIQSLESGLLKKIDLLLPISETDAAGFSEMKHSLPVMVCPTGMDLEKYPYPEENIEAEANTEPEVNAGIRLFYIGAMDWAPNREGLDWFFKKVWPEILKRYPDLKLHIAGRNSSLYISSRPPGNVIPEGEIDDALTFYRKHSVMVVPLLSGSGIRIKILEAMALGKVVISSSVGAGGLGIRNEEHLFIADTAEDYLRILNTLNENPNVLKEMGLRARQFVFENFDNLVLSKKLIAFYKAELA